MKRALLLLLVATLGSIGRPAGAGEAKEGDAADLLRQKAAHIMKDGNFKEAFDIYQKLAVDPADDPMKVGDDLKQAVACLQRLDRDNETDGLRERSIEAHAGEWRLLYSAAMSVFEDNHYGFMIAGEFQRGNHRGGGEFVNSLDRDRIRALQLLNDALPKAQGAEPSADVARLCQDFARVLLGYNGNAEAWRLQYLSDLSVLPDFDEGYRYSGRAQRGAPVDADGNPVFHALPKSYAAAKTDGERWRSLLDQAMNLDPSLRPQVLLGYAAFLQSQFGEQTLASYAWYFQRDTSEDKKTDTATYELQTLGEDETIAQLATGIKRFKLPDEYNYIRIYKQVADAGKGAPSETAGDALARIFENRRQYDTAAESWQQQIKRFGPGNDKWRQKALGQILDNWGQFEPVMTHPAGKEATVEFRFRNGKKADFEAFALDVRQLLSDVRGYLKSNPPGLDWNRVNVSDIGYRLVQNSEKKYLGDKAAAWSLALEPRAHHFDRRITVTTPLKQPGAYLLIGRMEDGNTSRIIIWIDDTVLVRKTLSDGVFFFVADAVSGKPVPAADLDLFGYRQVYLAKAKTANYRYNVEVLASQKTADALGRVILDQKEFESDYNWLVTATTPGGRLAYLGFSGVWYGRKYDMAYNQTKALLITDRPVYRPNQTVKFKFWVRHAQYDLGDVSTFANQAFTVRLHNAKHEKVYERDFTADAYGGLDGEYPLPAQAALGEWQVVIGQFPDQRKDPQIRKDSEFRLLGSGSFRVEEYKKPEFEVKVDAPKEPVMLGEKITATVTAKYYFGAPVTQAKVKIKVLRSSYSADWYPVAPWDWFYGPGYWWFGYDYDWYPGWEQWGCPRPVVGWWPRPAAAPELVVESETPIGADGIVKVPIDTSAAKAMHGDTDHKYTITAEVTDASRRTIVGQGSVLVARQPFKVYAWVDRGHYRVGDVVQADFFAQTLDRQPVQGAGVLRLYRIAYKDNQPVETEVQSWKVDPDAEGKAHEQIQASAAGQYRLSYTLTDAKQHAIEGGYIFTVMGEGTDGKHFRFDAIELVPDRKEYAPGEKVQLRINTDREDGTVVLFVRPANNIYLEPKILLLQGKSVQRDIEVTAKDMPNFFVEAFTVSDGKLYTDTREIVVPPAKRVLNVTVKPSADTYKPGAPATVKVRVTDLDGKPFAGSCVLTMYDKAVEYISGGSNVADIREFFWKWRRHHEPQTECSLDRRFANLLAPKEDGMQNLGVFGAGVADEGMAGLPQTGSLGAPGKGAGSSRGMALRKAGAREEQAAFAFGAPAAAAAPMLQNGARSAEAQDAVMANRADGAAAGGEAPAPTAEPVIRTQFADTAFWAAALTTDADGTASVDLKMPENLTGWKIRTWAMGHGTVVGEGTAEVVTAKDLILRLQAPRFFVEKDEVVLSANIHNYLAGRKSVRAVLETDGPFLQLLDKPEQTVKVDPKGEARVDWRVKVVREGEAVVRMKALTDEESDAMEMRFPVYVHGMLKTESFCGVIRRDQDKDSIAIRVPAERRIDQSSLEIRYSPTLAGALVDALPYLADYPYGCTEQTLDRFVPTVITRKILKDMGLDLAAIRDKRTNLNAQEIGDDRERAKQWKRWDRNPVFDEATVGNMLSDGLRELESMQLADGGWGWFSGWGERSDAHTTGGVVHGLQMATEYGVDIPKGMLERGVTWLVNDQAEETRKLQNAAARKTPWKEKADNLDAWVYMVLADAKREDTTMRDFLYRDRNELSLYGKAVFGLALHRQGQTAKRDMLISNIEQFLVQDAENQTAYLNLQNEGYWWMWYGSETEAQAFYLKLLAATDPQSEKAAGLVKYLLNNRKHATYWNSTRDTAYCIEAMADYLRASHEAAPDMTVTIAIDGQTKKAEHITADNLFTYDNKLVLAGDALTAGKHEIQVSRSGKGPVYFNAYLTNFTLEDNIQRAGLEIKVIRKYYLLVPADKTVKVAGARGQALDQKVDKFERKPIANLATLKSGDLVEVELELESKNDYEYLVFEDMKPAGFEPVDVRSGYQNEGLHAYVEFRDARVCFFLRTLARGKNSLAYRMRAEIPGVFSALPTRAFAMYAPELKANSDEIKLKVTD